MKDRVKDLVCPHCDSPVSGRANVCVRCGAEIVRGATRQERENVGCAFSAVALLIGFVAIGASHPPEPNSDSALYVVFGLLGFVLLAFFVGRTLASLLHRSKVRFLRSYDHR